jgi:hypothetical protein
VIRDGSVIVLDDPAVAYHRVGGAHPTLLQRGAQELAVLLP